MSQGQMGPSLIEGVEHQLQDLLKTHKKTWYQSYCEKSVS